MPEALGVLQNGDPPVARRLHLGVARVDRGRDDDQIDALRDVGLFVADSALDVLTAQTIKDGTIPLKKDGMMKVKLGITTPYEVLRVAESSD